jgi:hypothetical protein
MKKISRRKSEKDFSRKNERREDNLHDSKPVTNSYSGQSSIQIFEIL